MTFIPRVTTTAVTRVLVDGTTVRDTWNVQPGESGTWASTEAADTASLAGKIAHAGALSATGPTDTASLAGKIAHDGPWASTGAADTASLAGKITHDGAWASTGPTDVAAFTGTTVDFGLWFSMETADTAAFSGVFGHNGSLSSTEAQDAAASSGVHGIVGSWASLDPDTMDFEGALGHNGAWSSGEASDLAVMSGSLGHAGAWTSGEAVDVAAGSGTLDQNGTWASTEAADTPAFSGTRSGPGLDVGSWPSAEAADLANFIGTAEPANARLRSDTLLTISGFGTMLYQARGLTQTLAVIDAAFSQSRTISGVLVDTSGTQFRKYRSTISCSDAEAPPIDSVFPGMEVEVECACSLCYLTGNPGSPARQEVSGSSHVQGDYTFYRPVLTMLVRDVKQVFDEYKATYNWQVELEEV